ncbi:MAG: CPBP family intramembrane metalloprotease [candidate division Zixibacteria bacterium]|nr:CPBP family intramembrane metalloprotease [candidate division Zixibacteria bacterium]
MESMKVVIIGLLIPYSYKYPIFAILGLGVIVYYCTINPRCNRLGFRLTPSAKRALIIIPIIYLIINVFSFIMIQDVKYELHMAHESLIEDSPPIEKYYYAEWEPDSRFDNAVFTGSFSPALLLCWKKFLLLGVLAPIYETVFFFAILFPALWAKYSYRKAMLIVTIVFLILHIPYLNLFSIWLYILFVIISIAIYVKTKSIYPLIVYHALENITSLAFGIYLNWEVQTVYTNLMQ